jgi:glycosyltransferase involved in cell wall biosynthesis
MRVVLIADVFPPLRSSGAVQLRDLSNELVRQGHKVTVLVASPELATAWQLDSLNGVQVLRLRTPRTKDVSHARRAIGEFLMPYAMLSNLKKSPLRGADWDAVVWYSPSIFLGPVVASIKRRCKCPSYLILRDIFPEWAVDMGLMSKGLPYWVFKAVASYQYSVADIIGVQTPGNLAYFENAEGKSRQGVEVLHNWLAPAANVGSTIKVSETSLAGRKIFVYAGNMGIAQGMDILLDLAARLRPRDDVGFLFVGRGSDAKRLQEDAKKRQLDNVVFFDEIDPSEIPGLYAQCHVGLVALDRRHKTHNIPGKFLSYMQASLPALAIINPGNDLADLITDKRVGAVCTDYSIDSLASLSEKLLAELVKDPAIKGRCSSLSDEMFSAEAAVRQISKTLSTEHERKNILARTPKLVSSESTPINTVEAASEYSSKL